MRGIAWRRYMKMKHTKRRLKAISYNRYFSIDINDIYRFEGAIRFTDFLGTYEHFLMKDAVRGRLDTKYRQRYSRNKSRRYHCTGSMNTREEQKKYFRQILKENGII
jgi:hypothetical protein